MKKMIEIPDNATNGDVIKALFPNIDTEQIEDIIDVYGMSKCRVTYDTDWWNAPYKAESETQETETWNGIHAQITAPKGTFDKIWEEAESEEV